MKWGLANVVSLLLPECAPDLERHPASGHELRVLARAMDDDAWYDDCVSDDAELDRERRVRHERVAKKGFREGVTEGTEVHQQVGYAAGYRSGLAKARMVGFLEGCIAVRQALHVNGPDDTEAVGSQTHLLLY